MTQAEKPRAEVKSFESFEVKDEATGEVEAIIATLDVVDKDEDVIRGGAVKSGSKVKMSSYGHDTVGFLSGGALPVGKGVVTEEKGKLVFRGKVFTTTERGRDTIAVLKEMGADQQWSFGYRVTGSEEPDDSERKKGARRIITKADVFEVSPVLVGAGQGTRTVSAKEDGAALALAEQEAHAEEATRATAKAGAEEVAQAKKAAEDAEAKRLENEEAVRVGVLAEVKRLAETEAYEENAARTQAKADAAAAAKAAEEAEARRVAIEAEVKRLVGEAEQARQAGQAAEAKRLEGEAEVKRLAIEAESRRLAEDAEIRRQAGDAEVGRRAREAEVKRQAGEEAARLVNREAEQLAGVIAAEAERFRLTTGAVKSLDDAAETKRMADEAAAEFERFQKTGRYLGAA